MENNGKTIAILSYCTLVGLIIALVLHFQNSKDQRSSLGAFHIRQVVGLACTSLAMMLVILMFAFIPVIGWIIAICIYLCYFVLLVFFIMGLINAINSKEKPVPLVGELYQRIFAGIQ